MEQSIQERVMARAKAADANVPVGDDTRAAARRRSPTRKVVIGAAFVALIGAIGGMVAYFDGPWSSLLPSGMASSQPGEGAQADKGGTPFDEHVDRAGVRACAKLFPVLGKALTLGSTYSANSQWNKDAADAHAIQSVVGMRYDLPDYKGQAAGFVYASPLAEKCEGALVRVAPFPMPCSQVTETTIKGSAFSEELQGVARYKLNDNAGQALLIPSGEKSCVVVSVAGFAG